MVDIRYAKPADCVNTARFLVENFWEEYKDVFPPVDIDKTVIYVARHIEYGAVILVEDEDNIVGTLALMPLEYWFSKEKYLSEGVFYVKPQYRKTRAAFLLVKEAKAAAKKLKMPLQMAVTSGNDLERKDKFFSRMGLKRIGGIYRIE